MAVVNYGMDRPCDGGDGGLSSLDTVYIGHSRGGSIQQRVRGCSLRVRDCCALHHCAFRVYPQHPTAAVSFSGAKGENSFMMDGRHHGPAPYVHRICLPGLTVLPHAVVDCVWVTSRLGKTHPLFVSRHTQSYPDSGLEKSDEEYKYRWWASLVHTNTCLALSRYRLDPHSLPFISPTTRE